MQPRQIIIFLDKAASEARSKASCLANHSFEYGLRVAQKVPLSIEPTTISVFGRRTRADLVAGRSFGLGGDHRARPAIGVPATARNKPFPDTQQPESAAPAKAIRSHLNTAMPTTLKTQTRNQALERKGIKGMKEEDADA